VEAAEESIHEAIESKFLQFKPASEGRGANEGRGDDKMESMNKPSPAWSASFQPRRKRRAKWQTGKAEAAAMATAAAAADLRKKSAIAADSSMGLFAGKRSAPLYPTGGRQIIQNGREGWKLRNC